MSSQEIEIRPSIEAYVDDFASLILAIVAIILLYVSPILSIPFIIVSIGLAMLNGIKRRNWLLIGLIIGYGIVAMLYYFCKLYVGLMIIYFAIALLIELKYVKGIRYLILGNCEELAIERVLKIGPITIKEERGSRMTIFHVELRSNIFSSLLKHKKLIIEHRGGRIILKGVPASVADKVYEMCKYKTMRRTKKAS